MDVDVDGRVRYNGKAIVKMYVEGNDLLGSRYNIATRNFDPRDISAIEIYERHQPVKALEGIVGSDATALNIKLKPGACLSDECQQEVPDHKYFPYGCHR